MDISTLKVDTRAMADGRWVTVGGAYGDLKIFTRGFTDEFYDAQSAKMANAAQMFGGTQGDIPNAIRRRINAELLKEQLVLDVGNLVADGAPVPVAQFHEMLFQPDYVRLAQACWQAAARVSLLTKEQLESAEGNSGAASASTSQTTGSEAA